MISAVARTRHLAVGAVCWLAVSSACSSEDDTAAVPIIGVYEPVSFYPYCGTEVLRHMGTLWHQPTGGPPDDPENAKVRDEMMSVEREKWTPPMGRILAPASVPPPNHPDETTGTLIVWADGVASWTANAGRSAWLVDQPLDYSWNC